MHQKLQYIDVREHQFEDDGSIPNNPTLPLLVYPQVLAEHERGLPAARNYSLKTAGAAPG